jgi:hypothetical protein
LSDLLVVAEGFSQEFQRRFVFLEDEGLNVSDTLAVSVWRGADEPAERAFVNARLIFPTGMPSSWVGDSLVTVDRAFRWAVRAVEDNRAIDDLLLRSKARPATTRAGLVIDHVQPGSIDFVSEASDRLEAALRSRPYTFTAALIGALAFVGLEPHLEFGHDATGQPPPPVVNVQDNPVFNIILTVDGESVIVRCSQRR